MIELRLYKTRDDVSGGCPARLQYRYRAFHEGVIPGLGGYGEWSSWMDVPQVCESSGDLKP